MKLNYEILLSQESFFTWWHREGLQGAPQGAQMGTELPTGDRDACELRQAALSPDYLFQLQGQASPATDLQVGLCDLDSGVCTELPLSLGAGASEPLLFAMVCSPVMRA